MVFGVLAVLVALRVSWLIEADQALGRRLHHAVLANPVLLDAADAVTTFGNPLLVDVVIGVLAVVAMCRRQWPLALAVCLARLVALLTETLVKHALGRLRPLLPDPVAHASGYSFPSGHAAGAALYLTLLAAAVYTATAHRHRALALGVSAGCALAACAVAFSRLLLGVHFPSDVIGGLALGSGVALATIVFLGRPIRQT